MRGYCESLDHMLDDVRAHLQSVNELGVPGFPSRLTATERLPHFMLGGSLGGCLTLSTAIQCVSGGAEQSGGWGQGRGAEQIGGQGPRGRGRGKCRGRVEGQELHTCPQDGLLCCYAWVWGRVGVAWG